MLTESSEVELLDEFEELSELMGSKGIGYELLSSLFVLFIEFEMLTLVWFLSSEEADSLV